MGGLLTLSARKDTGVGVPILSKVLPCVLRIRLTTTLPQLRRKSVQKPLRIKFCGRIVLEPDTLRGRDKVAAPSRAHGTDVRPPG